MTLILPQRGRLRQPAAGGFTDPSDLFAGSNKGGWWDFSDTTTMNQQVGNDGSGVASASDPIGYLADKSGVGAAMVAPANNSTRPTYLSGGGASFVAGNSTMLTTTLPSASTSAVFYCAYVITMPATLINFSRIASHGVTGSADWNNSLYFSFEQSTVFPSGILTTRNSASLGKVAASTSTIYLFELLFDGSNFTRWINTSGSTPSAQTASFNIANIRLGAILQSSANHSTCYIHEAVCIDKDVASSGEQADLRTYLNNKWTIY